MCCINSHTSHAMLQLHSWGVHCSSACVNKVCIGGQTFWVKGDKCTRKYDYMAFAKRFSQLDCYVDTKQASQPTSCTRENMLYIKLNASLQSNITISYHQ
jgi:hypothetical protein